jgi:hypothetical protein
MHAYRKDTTFPTMNAGSFWPKAYFHRSQGIAPGMVNDDNLLAEGQLQTVRVNMAFGQNC